MGQMTHLRFGMDHLRELCAREQILLPEEFWNLYFDVSHFQNMFELMDERFCLYVQTGRRGKVSLHLYCLDPSVMLSSYLLQGRATVFYSATLLPIPYYEKLLTSSDKIYDMYAESPFDPDHLLILIGEDVTSLYKERSEAMYRNYARYITRAVQAHAGHYIVYFPSYHFMEQVYRYLPHSEDDHFNWMAQQPAHVNINRIEMMPVGAADAGSGVSNTYVLQKLKDRWPDLEPDGSVHGNGPAVYYKRPGYEGGIGLISAIHGKFCGYCNRVRLTSQGQLKPCLSFDTGTDLVPALRGTDEELGEVLRRAVYEKPKAHSFGDTENNDAHAEHRLMSQIGG